MILELTIGHNRAIAEISINASTTTTITVDNSNIRSEGDVAALGTNGQVITFSTPFLDTNYALKIEDFQNIGIRRISKSEAGFTFESLEIGLFDYIAIKNI